jgi:hypothetical protein
MNAKRCGVVAAAVTGGRTRATYLLETAAATTTLGVTNLLPPMRPKPVAWISVLVVGW